MSKTELTLDAEHELAQALFLLRQGRLIEAECIYNLIIRAFPNHSEALNGLGHLRLKRGDASSAVEVLQRALSVNPSSPQAHSNFANALAALHRHEESLEHFREVLRINPDDAQTHSNVGIVLRVLGRIDEAIKAFEQAINLDPQRVTYRLNLCLTKRTLSDDPHFVGMEKQMLRLEQLAPTEAVELHFTLGKMYADLGRNDESFTHFLVGNSMKRQSIVYDEGNALRKLDRMRSFFTAESIESMRGSGHSSDLPIFVLGMPRSGTTLVEQILASHPAVFGAGEFSTNGAPGIEFKGMRTNSPEAASIPSRELLDRFGAFQVHRLTAIANGAQRVVDKTLLNFELAGLIHLALPNARMIEVVRDSVDTCLSCFSTLFSHSHQPQTYDLGEVGRYCNAYHKLMKHWRNVLPTGAIMQVRYEELVNDFEGQARRLVKYCGLEWNESCLFFYKGNRPVRTASATQVRQPIYRTSIQRWRPPDTILRPLIESLAGC